MRVLGIDPGYDRLGAAVLEGTHGNETLVHSRCIETDRTDSIADRLLQLGDAIAELISTYEPDMVALETLFFNKNQKTAIAVAEARGVVLYLARTAGCDVAEFGPQEIKIAVTGYGNSDKDAVRHMLSHLVSGIPDAALDDEYDAIAVGLTCLAVNPAAARN